MTDRAVPGHAPPGAREWVGVIPGGGSAQRLAPLPCSKELLPLGFRPTARGPRPKVIAQYLLDALAGAGARQVYWLIDRSKTDIVQYFGSGAEAGVRLAYVPIERSPSVVHTLVSADEFLGERPVLFGFPDIVFEPGSALQALARRSAQSGADVVLGAVPAPPEQVADRVHIGPDGRALEIRVKPVEPEWPHAWILAAWAPTFTRFAREWLARIDPEPDPGRRDPARDTPLRSRGELYLGHALQAAIEAGLSIEVETFQFGGFIDVGTAAGLALALHRYGTQVEQEPTVPEVRTSSGGAVASPPASGSTR